MSGNKNTPTAQPKLNGTTAAAHPSAPKNGSAPSNGKIVPRVDSVVPVASTKWLALETYHYTDEDGKQRQWDVATRTTKPKVDNSNGVSNTTPGNTRSTADAVVIIPLLSSKSNPSNKLETLLVTQFRPPVNGYTMEFPAGLVDAGETVEAAALRELREETGFVGEFCSAVPDVSRAVCMSPGLATETVHVVLVQVDLDNPYNHGTPKPELDDGEHVTLHRVPLDEGLKTLVDTCPAMPIMGLYLFAMGFQLGKQQQQAEKK
ncbi:ADP-sugar pyrophosphatase [Seminavis robusta]|uniref:ADP-sugar pyrophosphatase n=1 Tax=Seminavis robusta TaxID=568900 RepID=A0A9N8ES95_9STRA|nr:ADP-sugar pyrophosphatase [Seminavis robusta]|eukprot:Sro1455_g274100.1 ADP-sugar pyrophosphatase (262) ;mRNA; f:1330-2115